MRKKILIIEDDLDLQRIYKLYFEKAGVVTQFADNGLKGIAKVLENPPDIILLDIMMPKMNGIEVLETIKSQSSIQIPIVVCSSLKKESEVKRIQQLGAVLFINKLDFKIEQLVQKVISCIK